MAVHFNTVAWSKGATLYEVNVRQYTPEGTFEAFAKHLPRLKDMGIDILWFMPITPISVTGRLGSLGSYYACSSYVNINPEYGTFDDFKRLVHDAHLMDFKVIIDWVANHTGLDHEWVDDHPDFYTRDAQGRLTERNGWKDVADLNYYSMPMRKAMINAMEFWIKECNIDGFRCDMAHLVPLDFWKEARTVCDKHKELFWLAECEEVPYHDVFDVTYAWWWMHESEKQSRGEITMNEIRNVLHAYSQYPAGASKLYFTSNHDENSWNGTEYEKYGAGAKTWAVFSFTWQGMPLVYSGQELPNHKRLKFFDKDQIDWNDQLELHQFYKQLADLHSTPVITEGETFILPSENANLMVYFRKHKEDIVLVILNLSASDRVKLTVEHPWLNGNFENIFSGLQFEFANTENFELEAYRYLVYKKVN